MRRLAALALVAALAFPAGADARSPLKPADMKTIRRDARIKGTRFAQQYGAKHWRATCAKRTLYSASCRIALVDIRAGTTDCAITLVYVVVGKSIQGGVGRNTCR